VHENPYGFYISFLLCDTMLAWYRLWPLVHLLQVSIVPKWLNIGSPKQRHTIARGPCVSDAKDHGEIPVGSPNTGGVG